MFKTFRRAAFVVSVNIAVLAALLALIEIGFRLTDDSSQPAGPTRQWQQFAPFLMFTNPNNPGGGFRWDDVTHGRTIDARIINNRHGFAMREEVDFSKIRPKAGNERVVVFTGGSTAWG